MSRAAFQEAVVDTLAEKSRRALRATGHRRLVVAGGVGANRKLRERLGEYRSIAGAELYFPRAEFCTDNGAMIALAGCLRWHGRRSAQGAWPGRQGALGARGRRLGLGSVNEGSNKIPMDKIFIHALKTEAIIGIFDWERQVKQTVIVDIEIGADVRKAALTDSIEDTLNYKRVAKRVLAFVEGSQFHLVESLAEHVAMLVLEEFGFAWVGIVLSKPGAVRGSRDVGVALERDRAPLEQWRPARERP